MCNPRIRGYYTHPPKDQPVTGDVGSVLARTAPDRQFSPKFDESIPLSDDMLYLTCHQRVVLLSVRVKVQVDQFQKVSGWIEANSNCQAVFTPSRS